VARQSGSGIFLLLLAAAAGGGAWWWWRSRQPALEEITTTAKKLPLPAGAILNIPATGHGAQPSIAKPNPWVTPTRGRPFEQMFLAATARYRLPAGLLSRLAARESNYNPTAKSSVGALGLMQIMPKFHPDLDPGELALDEKAALTPAIAIPYAAGYLRQLFDRFGKWTMAVAAYNAGPTAVAKYGGVPPFKETRDYVAAILPDVGIAQPEAGVRYA